MPFTVYSFSIPRVRLIQRLRLFHTTCMTANSSVKGVLFLSYSLKSSFSAVVWLATFLFNGLTVSNIPELLENMKIFACLYYIEKLSKFYMKMVVNVYHTRANYC